MPRARSVLAFAALSSAAVAGCVLLVPSSDFGAECTFAGQDTACGACIQRACQGAVNTCCDDATCRTRDMPRLDACARGDGCDALAASDGAAASVAACVTAACATECGVDLQANATCFSFGEDGCRCTNALSIVDGGAPIDNDGGTPTSTCQESDFGISAGACCAFAGWPDGGDCVCVPIRCLSLVENPKSCVCGLYAKSADFVEEPTCSLGQPCCDQPGACQCNESACTGDEVEVPECSEEDVAATIQCEDGVRVTQCP